MSHATSEYETPYHSPVLVHEVVGMLRGQHHMLDCTLGGGGHSLALLTSGEVDRVDALDRDPDAIAAAHDRLAAFEAQDRFGAHLANFDNLDRVGPLAGVTFDGILIDLGVSSHQIDDERRGFTFREGAELDMRMGPDALMDAASWLETTDEPELARVFREYADERRAFRLAREIVRRRENRPFATSDDLVGAIRGALGPRSGAPDFARLFQAVRIAVNDEIAILERALPMLRDRLTPGGVLAVIAYHSGEDRLVKNAFREWSADCVCPPRHPMCTCRGQALGETLTRRPVTASEAELQRNPRSRSARLRGWRRAA